MMGAAVSGDARRLFPLFKLPDQYALTDMVCVVQNQQASRQIAKHHSGDKNLQLHVYYKIIILDAPGDSLARKIVAKAGSS
jgi:hypothetical protein